MFIRALLRVRDDVTVEQIQDDYRCALTDCMGTDADVLELFGDQDTIVTTLNGKDTTKNGDDALLEVYRKLRPGEPPTQESAVKHLVPLLFDERRYDLSKVGRYKYNKKLGLAVRIAGHTLAAPVVNELTGEVIAEADELLTREKAREIEQAGHLQRHGGHRRLHRP